MTKWPCANQSTSGLQILPMGWNVEVSAASLENLDRFWIV